MRRQVWCHGTTLMIPEAPITVLIVVKGKADMYCFDMRLRTRPRIYQRWQSELTSMIRFDRPASITSLFNRLEVVRVQRPTFVVVAAWWYWWWREHLSQSGKSNEQEEKEWYGLEEFPSEGCTYRFQTKKAKNHNISIARNVVFYCLLVRTNNANDYFQLLLCFAVALKGLVCKPAVEYQIRYTKHVDLPTDVAVHMVSLVVGGVVYPW